MVQVPTRASGGRKRRFRTNRRRVVRTSGHFGMYLEAFAFVPSTQRPLAVASTRRYRSRFASNVPLVIWLRKRAAPRPPYGGGGLGGLSRHPHKIFRRRITRGAPHLHTKREDFLLGHCLLHSQFFNSRPRWLSARASKT